MLPNLPSVPRKSEPRHRAETIRRRARATKQISWSVVAYLVVVVLVKHYFGVDVSPL